MSQTQTLRELDAMLVAAFARAGYADAATYTPPGGGVVLPCTVLVDTEAQFYGDGPGEVAGYRTLVSIFLAHVPLPARGGTVVADGKSYRLDALDLRDESRERWVVDRV